MRERTCQMSWHRRRARDLVRAAVIAAVMAAVAGGSAQRAGAAGDAAGRVLGQPSLAVNGPNIVGSRGLHSAALWAPQGVALDRSTEPNRLYVADTQNSRVLGWKNAANFQNGAPADLVIGQPDFLHSGCNTGSISARSLCNATGIAVDLKGNLYVADSGNNRVLEYDSPFTKDTVADRVYGQNGSFAAHKCNSYGVTPGTLCKPTAVALDSKGNLYVADSGNNRVLQYNNPLTGNGIASRVFGQHGNFLSNDCNADGISAESLCGPNGVAVDGKGRLYVADNGNNRILRFDQPRRKSLAADRVAGQKGSFTTNDCNLGGPASAATLCSPNEITVDFVGHLYVADSLNNRVVEFSPPLGRAAHAVRVLGQANFAGDHCNAGGISAVSLCHPGGVAVDALGNLYVADNGNNRLLFYSAQPSSNGTPAKRVLGQVDFRFGGVNMVSRRGLYEPSSVVVDRSTTPNHIYVVDSANSRVLGWTNAAAFEDGAPADIVLGQPDFLSSGCNTDGLSAKSLCGPTAVTADAKGNLYVADSANNRVVEYDAPIRSAGGAHLVFGQNNQFDSNDCDKHGRVSAATLCDPSGVAADAKGNLYVADLVNNRVLEYDTPLAKDTVADRVFGQAGLVETNNCNPQGVGSRSLCKPSGVALDANGDLYIVDTGNNRVIKYASPLEPDARPASVFGQGGNFTSADCNSGGTVAAGTLCTPMAATFDGQGNLYVADSGNNRVLEYSTPFGASAAASRVLGQSGNFTTADCNLGGVSGHSLCAPSGVAFDLGGHLYIADSLNNRVLGFSAGAAR